MTGAEQIHEESGSSRNTSRKLPEERISRIDVGTLPILRAEQASFLPVLAGVMA